MIKSTYITSRGGASELVCGLAKALSERDKLVSGLLQDIDSVGDDDLGTVLVDLMVESVDVGRLGVDEVLVPLLDGVSVKGPVERATMNDDVFIGAMSDKQGGTYSKSQRAMVCPRARAASTTVGLYSP